MIQLKVGTLLDRSLGQFDLTLPQTMLNCIDNSGAAIVECVMIVGQKRHAAIGMTALYVLRKSDCRR